MPSEAWPLRRLRGPVRTHHRRKVNIEENKNRIAELKAEGNVSDADIPHVETDVPPEEPVDGGCGCCDHEVAPEEVFSDDDKPQE